MKSYDLHRIVTITLLIKDIKSFLLTDVNSPLNIFKRLFYEIR